MSFLLGMQVNYYVGKRLGTRKAVKVAARDANEPKHASC